MNFFDKRIDFISEQLSVAVIKNVSDMRRDKIEELATILNTKTIAQSVLLEMKQYNIPMKCFSSVLNINSATFSLALRDPRHWFDANEGQKRCYYYLFLWLNLPQKYRKSTFHFDITNDEEDNKEEFIPALGNLIGVVARELAKHNIDMKTFASMILNEDSLLVSSDDDFIFNVVGVECGQNCRGDPGF